MYIANNPEYILRILLISYSINITTLLNHSDASHLTIHSIEAIIYTCEIIISLLRQSHKETIHEQRDLHGSLPLGSYVHRNCSSLLYPN
jgi:hypothetical protein